MIKHILTSPYTTGSQVAVAKLTMLLPARAAPLRHGLIYLLLAGLLIGNPPAPAVADFILFPAVRGTARSIDNPGEHFKRRELLPEVDVFYSADKGRFRFLSEVLLTTEDSVDVERLQAGWLVNPDTTVWFGRHHSPLGYWNTQFHHGAYLQTAISRPAISTFDDHGGVLTTHVTGLSVEGQQPIGAGGAALPYSFSMGLGPTLDHEHGLEALDLLHINRGEHKLVTTFRLGYRPDPGAGSEVGVFINYGLIPSNMHDTDEIRQSIAGAYANWEHGAARIIGELYAIHNTLKGMMDAPSSGGFISANVQAEYMLSNDWTIYARAENTFGGSKDPYLANFYDFISQRNLAGVRFELDKHQTLTVELANAELQDQRFNQIDLQWSAAFP